MVNAKSKASAGDYPGELPPYESSFDNAGGPSYVEESNGAYADRPPPVLTPGDTVIAVMGVTGAGKTTFISHFAPDAKVGHGLESCTAQVGIYEIYVGDRKVYLIDTPGFDDTHRSDTDILREVANWLNLSYQAQIKLTGIIYLHRIVDNRMGGSAMKNLRMFKRLCGDEALSCVVLATTMWSQVTPEDGANREHELVTRREFWAGMVEKGSKVLRQDEGGASAVRIMQHILSQRRRVDLNIQREMASGKTLDETSAGQEVQAEMEAIKRRYESEMAALRDEMEQARRDHDLRAQEEIAAVRADLEEKLRRDREDREKMRVDMEQLRLQRSEELAAERDEAHRRELEWEREKMQLKIKMEMEKAANASNAATLQLRYDQAVLEAENERLKRAAAAKEEECVIL